MSTAYKKRFFRNEEVLDSSHSKKVFKIGAFTTTHLFMSLCRNPTFSFSLSHFDHHLRKPLPQIFSSLLRQFMSLLDGHSCSAFILFDFAYLNPPDRPFSSNFGRVGPWYSQHLNARKGGGARDGRIHNMGRIREQGRRAGLNCERWGNRWRGRGGDGSGGENLNSVGASWGGGSGGRRQGRLMSKGRVDWTQHQYRGDRRPRWGDDGGDFRRGDRGPRSSPGYDEHRQWCSAENDLPPNIEKFVIASYNVLADKNAAQHHNELYYHIPRWMMQWDRRRDKLVEELGELSPDVMCLQEVDKFEDLDTQFKKRGYGSAYKCRTGGARDGCAIFWKLSRFRLLQAESIQFNELNLRDNVAQLCVFQIISGEAEELDPDSVEPSVEPDRGIEKGPQKAPSLVVVGNIHVLFNPKRGDVKLGQVRTLVESAHALSEKWGGAPVALAGDFNSTPMSDLYKFLATSELDISGLNRATMSGQVEAGPGSQFQWMPQMEHASYTDTHSLRLGTSQVRQSLGTDSPSMVKKRSQWTAEELLAATGTLDCTTLCHSLNLRSSYSQIKGGDGCRGAQGEPLITTFHRKFMGTVDYIWHTEGIDTVKVLDTLPAHVLQRSNGLPSQEWGSDHLALVCELAFLPVVESQNV